MCDETNVIFRMIYNNGVLFVSWRERGGNGGRHGKTRQVWHKQMVFLCVCSRTTVWIWTKATTATYTWRNWNKLKLKQLREIVAMSTTTKSNTHHNTMYKNYVKKTRNLSIVKSWVIYLFFMKIINCLDKGFLGSLFLHLVNEIKSRFFSEWMHLIE